MLKQRLLTFALGLVVCQAAPQPKDLICDICVDVLTDLDEWITSDSTEGEIIHFLEGVS